MPHVNKHYRAFISYSHKDARWAKWLHKGLEQYHVPIDAYPQEEQLKKDGTKKSRRLSPVFRDRDELPASGSLADTIYDALAESENLIVLCSPSSAASQYVNAEIDIFRGLRPDNHQNVYALIIEGEPPSCFPAALTAGGVEPIAADAREHGDGKADAKLKLIAGMLGVGFDRLKQREATRQRNRLIALITVVSAVAVMTSFLAVWALKAEKEATKQKVVAQEQRELAVEQRELAVKAEKVAVEEREKAVEAEKVAVEERKKAEDAEKVAVEERKKAEQAAEEEKKAKLAAEQAAEEERKAKLAAEQSAREAKAVLAFFDSKVLAAARPKQQEGGLGIDATIRAAIDAAEPQITRAFTDQPRVEATIRSTMGTSYWYLGEAKIAIPQLQRALALRVKELGVRNLDTLKSMRALANAYHRAGRKEDALELRIRNFNLEKEELGPKNVDTLTAASNLAISYREVGQLKEALALDEETLKLRKEVLGPDDPGTISSMGSLASTYVSMGRNEEALPIRTEVLKMFKKELGPGHPDTLSSMQNLANSYDIAGREKEARALHEKTLKLRIEVQGPEHPDTLAAKYNMANTFINTGRWEEAVSLHEKTLKSMVVVLGDEHRDTVGAMNSLAYAYWKIGREADGVKMYRQVIVIQKKNTGADFRYFYTQSLLGQLLTEMKKYTEAEPMLLDGFKGMESTVSNSTRTQLKFAAGRLVNLYEAWGKPKPAATWNEKYDLLEVPQPKKK